MLARLSRGNLRCRVQWPFLTCVRGQLHEQQRWNKSNSSDVDCDPYMVVLQAFAFVKLGLQPALLLDVLGQLICSRVP